MSKEDKSLKVKSIVNDIAKTNVTIIGARMVTDNVSTSDLAGHIKDKLFIQRNTVKGSVSKTSKNNITEALTYLEDKSDTKTFLKNVKKHVIKKIHY